MGLVCKAVIGGYLLLYVAALAIALVGTLGLFGVAPDGLAAVYLIFLGFPWTLALAPLMMAGLPVVIGQAVAVVAPVVNLWIAHRLCKGRD